MNEEAIKWDSLSDHFDTHKDNPDPGVAANINSTWPALKPLVTSLTETSQQPSRVLDYGCGTGRLANRLLNLGLDVTASDISPRMIEVARSNSSQEIRYLSGDVTVLTQEPRFDLIISLMVFQFIEEIENTTRILHDKLKKHGILWFATHNEDYVFHETNDHTNFLNLDSESLPKRATLELSGTQLRTYLRSAILYENLLKQQGFSKKLEWYSSPYEDGTPPKYLVMAFSK